MRLAVISDIHGNLLALDAVLADVAEEGADAILNLGDIVSGPLAPAAVADLLIETDFPTIKGNHDRYVRDTPAGELRTVDRFVAGQLGPAHLSWLRSLPATRLFEGEVFMSHGTPASDEEPWLDHWWDGRTVEMPDERQVTARAGDIDQPVLLCGHTHVARVTRLRDGRLIVNPGAVGLQFNLGSPLARYALIDRKGGDWSAALRAVPYDYEAAAQQAERNGFPHWREALTTGWAPPKGLF
jgi:predicted phosphodiesterase